jgi:RNA polymerase sigma-70 factor (ECF subfamily)
MDPAVPNPDSDEYLATRWRQGDARAYEAIVKRHLDPLHRFLISRCANPGDADDLCQEVFLEVCKKISNYTPGQSFTGWLYTIARRRAIDHWRKTRPMESFDPDQHGGTSDHSPAHSTEEHEEAVTAWNKVHALLSENQATALWLKVQGGHSISEIASMMGQSPENVRVLLFRGRQQLATLWNSSPTHPRS